MIREYGPTAVSGSYAFELPGTKQGNRATVTVTTGELKLVVTQGSATVYTGTLSNGGCAEIKIENKTYKFTFTGTGTVQVDYRGGML